MSDASGGVAVVVVGGGSSSSDLAVAGRLLTDRRPECLLASHLRDAPHGVHAALKVAQQELLEGLCRLHACVALRTPDHRTQNCG